MHVHSRRIASAIQETENAVPKADQEGRKFNNETGYTADKIDHHKPTSHAYPSAVSPS